MKRNLTFLMLVLSVYSYAQTTASTLDAEFVGTAYRIKHPKAWQEDTSRAYGADLFLFSALEGDTDKFRENINVLIQSLGGQPIDLAQYKELTEGQLKGLAEGVQVFESRIVGTGPDSYYRVAYSMVQGGFKLRILSKCMIHNGNAYLATLTTESDKYDSYKAIGEAALNTFVLVK